MQPPRDGRDRVQHARMVTRPAARTGVQRANDNALEWLIFVMRLAAVVAALGVVQGVYMAVWTLDWRWAATAVLSLVLAGGCGWWGWWVKGNEAWRDHGGTI